MKISIIIPTYNEAENIASIILYLQKNNATEIIVCDGGSTDNTISIAKNTGALAIVSPQKGRAAQMNYGASLSTGDVLYFVHADTIPPENFYTDIKSAVLNGYQFGRYQTEFVNKKFVFKFFAWFTQFDWFSCYGGDQTFFITKKLFDELGGFDEKMQIMEEYAFTEKAKKNGKYKIFSAKTLISTRKYKGRSWWRVQWANFTIIKMYKKGVSQIELVKKYKQMLK
jgi:rSAM/selenodomain-associated transferase 2